ncbi:MULTISPECIES: sugar phosphate isomerase/epimerase family protein [Bacillus]|uniref:3-dehydroshikimate dehydratase n=7 Tax=Bacillus cereus group TaxID=86661 RepID=A0A9W5QVV0_BACCE|nr:MULTISPECIES: sugar phosphate isomerase/epimerase family protein [Bacillus cereus group]EEM42189.1 Xylose isomerase domain protein TIM barrel [Bacillus thuringiensis serovar sotto str. T04001]ACK93219.1 petrobactin biosynthesis protein AsbF [Bacillus cereus G9842]AFQ15472.1 petrobactin biosynthesis protein AsbF [Bacillus thuringiensis HD-771]AQY38553.1 3-dehydroshikimate dehydratase [Bacillus thuringiensis]EJP87216.1 3-dehydroshikimate dehydratase [Bacillus cereus VD022]
MKYSLCTISFRHQLISFTDIVQFAYENGFEGIELWGTHAQNLYMQERETTERELNFLKDKNLEITMISDYLDISLSADFEKTIEKSEQLVVLANWFNTNKIRTFAGQKGSEDFSEQERKEYVKRIHKICDVFAQHNMYVLLETHPNTLTDTLPATIELLEEVNHPNLKINLDFLHIWESGADPIDSFHQLKPWTLHYHFKNISSANYLHVFEPNNVYAAAGSRIGMVPLFEGIVNYDEIIQEVRDTNLFASLEWFGHNSKEILKEEMKVLISRNLEVVTS